MAKNLFWISTILLVALLTGCSHTLAPTATLAPTETLTPAATLIPTAPTTPSPTRVPTATGTPTPTLVSASTETQTATQGPTATFAPTLQYNARFTVYSQPGLPGKIIFNTLDGSNIMNADGSGLSRLTYGKGELISQDGKHKVINHWDGLEIQEMKSDGTWSTRFEKAGILPISWSPDGRKILCKNEIDQEYCTINADGTELTSLNIPKGDLKFIWSPDNQKLAIIPGHMNYEATNFRLDVVNVDGSDLINLTSDIGTNELPSSEYKFIWSPDSRKIAYVTFQEGNYQIFVINADGSEKLKVTHETNKMISFVNWLPDSQRIGATFWRFGDDSLNLGLHIIYLDGSEPTKVSDLPNWTFAFSPDEKKIAFADACGISIIDSDGTHRIKLINLCGYFPSFFGSISWIP